MAIVRPGINGERLFFAGLGVVILLPAVWRTEWWQGFAGWPVAAPT